MIKVEAYSATQEPIIHVVESIEAAEQLVSELAEQGLKAMILLDGDDIP
jgi:hypothetical protein